MKKFMFLAIAAAMMATVTSCDKKGEGNSPLEDSLSQTFGQLAGPGIRMQMEQMRGMGQGPDSLYTDAFYEGFAKAIKADTTAEAQSYNAGYTFGSQVAGTIAQFKEQGINFNVVAFLNEFKKSIATPVDKIDQTKMMQLNGKIQEYMSKLQAELQKKVAAEGKKYMEEALKNGFKKDASGIAYKVEKEGNGKKFKDGDNVSLKYKGMHVNGKVFDQAKKAVEFEIDEAQLVKGFVAALRLMSPGAKYTVIIPAELGYGEQGQPQGGINGGETLVFEIETGELAPAKAAPAMPAAPAKAPSAK